MGISVAATIQNGGYAVWWASEGRSDESRARAEQHRLNDAGDLASLCAPLRGDRQRVPAARRRSDRRRGAGKRAFAALYIDANAIAPQRAQRIGAQDGRGGRDLRRRRHHRRTGVEAGADLAVPLRRGGGDGGGLFRGGTAGNGRDRRGSGQSLGAQDVLRRLHQRRDRPAEREPRRRRRAGRARRPGAAVVAPRCRLRPSATSSRCAG